MKTYTPNSTGTQQLFKNIQGGDRVTIINERNQERKGTVRYQPKASPVLVEFENGQTEEVPKHHIQPNPTHARRAEKRSEQTQRQPSPRTLALIGFLVTAQLLSFVGLDWLVG